VIGVGDFRRRSRSARRPETGIGGAGAIDRRNATPQPCANEVRSFNLPVAPKGNAVHGISRNLNQRDPAADVASGCQPSTCREARPRTLPHTDFGAGENGGNLVGSLVGSLGAKLTSPLTTRKILVSIGMRLPVGL